MRVPLTQGVAAFLLMLAIVGCGTTPGGSPGATPGGSSAEAAGSPAGVVSFGEYKDWTGFTNRIGTVRAGLRQLADHGLPLDESVYADTRSELERVVAWFGQHEAAACWQGFYTAVRETADPAFAELVAVHDAAAAGSLSAGQTSARLGVLHDQFATLVEAERSVDCS